MLTDKERRELLEKHLEAKARNSLRLVLMGGAMAAFGAIGMTYDPDKASAYVIVLLLGLCGAAIGAQD